MEGLRIDELSDLIKQLQRADLAQLRVIRDHAVNEIDLIIQEAVDKEE